MHLFGEPTEPFNRCRHRHRRWHSHLQKFSSQSKSNQEPIGYPIRIEEVSHQTVQQQQKKTTLIAPNITEAVGM